MFFGVILVVFIVVACSDDFNCNNTIYNTVQVWPCWGPRIIVCHFFISQKKSGSVRRHMTSYLSHEVRVSHKLKRDNIQPGEHVHNRSVNAWVRGPRLETDHSIHGRPICKGDDCFCVLSSKILLRLEETSLVRFGTTTR